MRNVLYSEKVLYSNSSCIYENSHEPEAIGIPNDQMKSSLNLSYSYEDIMKFQNRPFYFLFKKKIHKIISALKILQHLSVFLILNYIQNHQMICMEKKKSKHFCITMAKNYQPRQLLVSSLLCQLPSPLIFQLNGKHFVTTWQSNQKMTLSSSCNK